ncbi:glycosyltransferase family 4 protein [Williamwhitmania taraxaci]|uniref:Glycosyltransferase involved in cell wall bisynthesis n=1 Tax=Williamwhitmania taraxaci TaxID=1640674 RepID=A0A1G6GQK6_9BACT|nr:glycosyltransferase family 4 protein [Williamwhitmania taraxaci]SDB84025.1 Glycosyltransferase involved in cell wall bisynthesis [Williamwhitmania taraxaci]
MRILIVTNKVPYPAKDGGAIATLNMALGLATQGASITVLAINTLKHFSPVEEIPNDILKRVGIKAATVDTSIKLWPALKNLLFSRKPYISVRFENEAFLNLLQKEITTMPYDIIQLEGPYLEAYIKTIRAYSTAPIVLRAHNIEHEIWDRTVTITSNPFKKVYLRILANRIERLEKNTLRRVDAVIPITKKDAQSLLKSSPTIPCHIAPTGLNEAHFTTTNSHKIEQSLFHLGGLDWTPNQAGLIWFLNNCWPAIRAAVPNARFFIAGRHAPKTFIKAIKLPCVEFMGEVGNAQLFMQTHGIMVVPLLSGSGMRIKIIEGMAASTPIVSTSIGAEGIEAVSGKDIVIADTPEAIIEACISLLLNVELANQIAKNGCNFAQQHFNNDEISHKVMEFYQSLLLERNNKSY